MKIDKQLIDRCLEADKRAQLALYKQCYSMMKSTCCRYISQKDDQSDVMNQAFLKILNGIKYFDINKRFEPWAKRIVINTALDYCRKLKRTRGTTSLDDVMAYKIDSHRWSESSLAELNFDAEELLTMISQLEGTTAQVFNLYAIDGYTHEQVSKALNMSASNSKWHLAKARRTLIDMIEKKSIALNNKLKNDTRVK